MYLTFCLTSNTLSFMSPQKSAFVATIMFSPFLLFSLSFFLSFFLSFSPSLVLFVRFFFPYFLSFISIFYFLTYVKMKHPSKQTTGECSRAAHPFRQFSKTWTNHPFQPTLSLFLSLSLAQTHTHARTWVLPFIYFHNRNAPPTTKSVWRTRVSYQYLGKNVSDNKLLNTTSNSI